MSMALPPDQQQRERAVDPARSVLVRAPAGSGKTGVLLLRYLRCLLAVEQPEQVVAITFTNKAAGEIKERVLTALAKGGRGEPANAFDQAIDEAVVQVLERDDRQQWRLLQNTARLRIATFDSFCASVTRRLPLLSGMGAPRPLTDTDALYRDAILALFRQLDEAAAPSELRGALERLLAYGHNRIESLAPLLAALLAKRDQWLEDILSGDAEAMEQALRTEVLGLYELALQELGTCNIRGLLEAFCASSGCCEDHAWAAALDPAIADEEAQFALLQQVAVTMLNGKGEIYKAGSVHYARFLKGQPGTDQVKSWLKEREAEGASGRISTALATLAELPPPYLPSASRQLVEDFRHALRYLLAYLRLEFERRGGVDFGEIAQRAIYALRAEDEVGEALLMEDRVEHILVDEMQDTSVSQIQLLSNLCQHWQEGDGRSVFFCGDLQQSIYAFRGSLVDLFDELIRESRFANRSLEQVQLLANFRSSAALVEWVNSSFSEIFARRGRDYVPAQAQRQTPGGVHVHPLRLANGVKAADQAAAAEAAGIVELIQRVRLRDQASGTVSSIAILVRSRRHLSHILPALKAAGIDFSGQDIDRLSQTPAVLDFTALLRSLWHEADDLAWARLLRAPFIGCSWEDLRLLRQRDVLLRDAVLARDFAALSKEGGAALQRLADTVEWLEAQPQSRDLRWALRSAWHLLGGPACVAEHEYRDIDRVLDLLDDYAPAGLLEDSAALEAAIERLFATPPASSLELMTVHKSKGLEFDVVILPGLGSRGRNEDSPLLVWQRLGGHMVFAPKAPAGEDDAARFYRFLDRRRRAALDEELDRQLYVALTRAKSELHLFGVVSDNAAGEPRPEAASFLGRLWPVVADHFEEAASLQGADPQNQRRVPLAPRLRGLDIALKGGYEPPILALSPLQQARRYTENAVLEDNIEERAVGIVFHELMEVLGRGGAHWLDSRQGAQLMRSVRQRLRHHCHPEPGLDDSVAEVLELLANTRGCADGQWLLSSYDWQANEQTLRRLVGGQWQTLILDRVFIESGSEGDKCWIIDYKTARARGKLDAFLEDQTERYRAKMTLYRDALSATGVKCPITTALYFPAHQRLVVLEY